MTKEEAFQEYEEVLARISKQAAEAREKARAKLREQLKALQVTHHEELKAIRDISQKIKRKGGEV